MHESCVSEETETPGSGAERPPARLHGTYHLRPTRLATGSLPSHAHLALDAHAAVGFLNHADVIPSIT